jgi:putative peptide zinc metalloprotease protein
VFRYLWPRIGWFSVALVATMAAVTLPSLLRGLVMGEFRNMLTGRPRQLLVWAAVAGAFTALALMPVTDRAGGPFYVRSVTRAELRARVAGFIREVRADEGDRVTAGQTVLVLEVPDLESRLAQKNAEVREVQAKLKLLEAGPRPEERREQRLRIDRAVKWRDLAQSDLERARRVMAEDLGRLDERIAHAEREVKFAETSLDRFAELKKKGSASDEEVEAAERRLAQAKSDMAQEQAQRRGRAAQSTTEAEAELAKREKELSDARSVLTILEAGTRPEEIESERAHLHRLDEEVRFLQDQKERIPVISPVAGLVLTPRLKDKIGQYVREGELIVQIEEPSVLEAEIALGEQDVPRVEPGQIVELVARSVPFSTYRSTLERVSPSTANRVEVPGPIVATHGETPGAVTLYCRVPNESALRSGMTGYARIQCGKRPLGVIAGERVLRYLRTEFWW